ncbi:Asp23/Gls24 family envelope stress response protein [Halanaerobaculum tunisiense]
MSNSQRLTNDLGVVNISEEVISIIAGVSAIECYGLVGMAGQGIQDDISKLLGKKDLDRGIDVEVVEEGVKIDLYIIVEYGVKISEVAHNVIDRVQYTIEEKAGVKLKEININVQGVRIDHV